MKQTKGNAKKKNYPTDFLSLSNKYSVGEFIISNRKNK
jgi:hypothetical protein